MNSPRKQLQISAEMEEKMQTLTRRDFIKLAAGAAGGIVLAGCRGGQPLEITAVPAPTPSTGGVTPPLPTLAPGTFADTVLVNGRVVTMDKADTVAQAVAVRNDVILKTGSDQVVRAMAGAQTKVIDLRGRTLTPGMIDSHNHLEIQGRLNTFYVPLLPPKVKTMKDLQASLAEVIAKTPKGQWIQGVWLTVSDNRAPNRLDLDPVSPDHPVWIMQQGGHYGTANSFALKAAGITSATPNPTGGIIERDSKGDPTGLFYNHRAMDVLRRVIPPAPPTVSRDAILSAQQLFAACGVTSFQDNNVRLVDVIRTYTDLAKQGKMSLRGRIYYTLEWEQNLDTALKEMERYADPFTRFAGYKLLIDGQGPTLYTHEPHKGVRSDMPTWEPASYKKTIRALHDTGLQICVHCGGDAAIDLTLDAFEEAMKANPRPDPRHRLEHAIFMTPQAVQRTKALGVVVSAQPQFIRMSGDYWQTLFSEKLLQRAIVTREWLEAGVPLALGSDAPTTPWYTPAITLALAISRLTASNKIMGPDQRMTIQEAMRAHTMGSAYAAFEENLKGSLEPGKLADLALWTDDPYTLSPQQLFYATIDMTIVGGKVVYQKS